MSAPSTNAGKLFNLMTMATALSFGGLAALAASMTDFLGGDASLHFSHRTVIGFVIGAAVGWGLWRVVRFFLKKSGDDVG